MLNTISAYWHMVGVAFIVVVLIIVPDEHQSFGVRLHARRSTRPATAGGGQTSRTRRSGSCSASGSLLSQYTITGFDASAHTAEETKSASRMAAVGMYMSVVVSVVFGCILLVAVTFAIPSTEGALENIGVVVPWIWAESMSQNWSEVLLFICVRGAVLLPHGVGDVGVADDVRVLARPCRPGHQLWRKVAPNRVPGTRWSAIGVLRGAADGPGDLELPRRLRGRDGDRGDRPLHRLHPARCYLRFRQGDSWDRAAAPGASGSTTSGSTSIAILWVALITILFIFPLYKAGLPWEDDFAWELTNYTGPLVRGDRHRLRRLVVPLGEELVQGPCAWAPRRSSSGWRRSSAAKFALPTERA